MTNKTFLSLALAVLATLPAVAQRDTISLNRGWLFCRTPQGPAEVVNLPHDFQISQLWVAPSADERADNSDQAANVKSRLSARGFKEMGEGFYRKTLHAPQEWKGRRVLLDFGGIMLVGDVWLNGRRVGGTEYGYLGFEVDVTSLLRYGEDNQIEVRANTMGPKNSRWYTGGGLYRDVKIILTPADLYFVRHPLQITTKDNHTVNITAEISRYNKDATGRVGVRILDAAGREVAARETEVRWSPRRRTMEYRLDPIALASPKLWSCETPYLYTAEVSIYGTDGRLADRVSEPFGVRTVEITADRGLLLNGKKVLLKGIANHHTLGVLGAAAFPRAIEKRIRLLKQFGFNHIRCSHNPYSEDLYRLCDRYGLLVVDELYDKWLTQYAGGRTEWTNLWQQDVPEWVKRDRNHPSVVLWSLGNELQTYPSLPFNDWGVTPYKLLRELLHRYDTTRLVTVAMHPRGRNWETDSLPCDLAMLTDVQAYNYRYMYFPGDGRRFPWMKFYQSEANLPMMGPNFYEMDREKVIGLAYWGMIDYLGESMGWPAKGWVNGVFDISLQPKPMAYFLKSMFSAEPTVHIGIVDNKTDNTEWNGIKFGGDQTSDHWNRTEGNRYTVYVYTNADEAELFVNGRSLGVQKNTLDPKTRNKLKWNNVAYVPGSIEAVARKAGRVVARHRIETAGSPVALRLEADDEMWRADGTDLQHVRVYAVDSKGRRSPMAQQLLTFSLEGDASLAALGNGDLTGDDLPTGIRQHLFRGSALAILRAGYTPSKVRLIVSAPGLKGASLKLQTTGK